MTTPHNNKPVSLGYSLYSVGFGLSLFIIIFYSGIKHWPVWQSIVLGSVVQFFYGMSKRVWLNQYGRLLPMPCTKAQTQAKYRLARSIALGYAGSFVICAIWYGLGRMVINP